MMYIIAQTALETTRGHERWSTNGLHLDVHFYPPFVNSAFNFLARLFADGDQQTKLNQTLLNDGQ